MSNHDTRSMERYAAVVAAVVVVAFGLSQQCGCSSVPASTVRNGTKASTYGAELDLCVVKATTKADGEACMCEVATRWQRPCDGADGGIK